MTSPLRRSGNQPKRRGRDIAWNGKVARLWDLIAKYTNAAIPVHCCPDQEIIKHHFHMVPSWRWLDHGGLALGKQAGKQQRAFHLRACNRRLVTNAAHGTAPDAQRWRLFGTFRDNLRTHLAKRRNDAVHWTF